MYSELASQDKILKISHLTSAHPRYDTRIFLKECRSLVLGGHAVSLVVADGKGDEFRDGVSIVDVGAPSGRLDRMRNVTKWVFREALAQNADVYHLHDPELIPIGIKLKKLGKKVVFDAHEDVPKQLLSKPYLNKPARMVLSRVFGVYESWACKQFDAIVAATPYIRDKFLSVNENSLDVNNFPMLGELVADEVDWARKENKVCYVGGISEVRGVHEAVEALQYVNSGARLQLGGRFTEQDFENRVKASCGWSKVDELGWLGREGVVNTLQSSLAGLVTLKPIVNYLDALPVKMFEYMAAGIPVIASHFPLWREIVEENDCGLCVDPLDSRAIAKAIDFMAENPGRAEQMGRNGRRAVNARYNWGFEEAKLLRLYDDLASTT